MSVSARLAHVAFMFEVTFPIVFLSWLPTPCIAPIVRARLSDAVEIE